LEKQSLDQGAGLFEKMTALTNGIRETGREQREAMAKLVAGLTGPLEALAKVQEGEKQLIHLQEVLNQNLSALSGAGAFEQAVNSLTAAIHLMTARAGGVGLRVYPAQEEHVTRKGSGAA
jgi:hypothetical protein